MAHMTRIGIAGVAGRMGRRIAALAIEAKEFDIVTGTEAAGHEAIGKDIGELAGVMHFDVQVTAEMIETPDVLIDFSLPSGTMASLEHCRARRVPMIIGTTGLSDEQRTTIAEAAKSIAIVHTANYSVGVNVLLKVVGLVAKTLGAEYDIDVTETHHRFKKDAPSGTALALAKAICAATGKDPAATFTYGRHGDCPRKPGEIGIHALRVGDTVGEHTIHFGNLGETITIGHSAHTRDTFARGSLRAAQWIVGKKPGLYTMQDVLGL